MRPSNPLAFADLAHIDATATGGRTILLMPLWEDEQWHQWIDLPDGKLMKMQVVDAIRTNYLAKAPAREDDIHVELFDFLWQSASFPQVARGIFAIADDVNLLATIAAKLDYMHRTRDKIPSNLVTSFVQSEIEHVIVLSRSIFDLLQEIIAFFWNECIVLSDPAAEALRKRHKLPPSFAKIVFAGGELRTAAEIAAQYGLPSVTAEAYARHAPFFGPMRDWRDHIVHGGVSVQHIFDTEKGFCVDPKSKYFRDFPWSEDHYYNPNIVSLRPWLAHTVLTTLQACEDVLLSLASVIPFPPPIAPNHKVFIRDPSNRALIDLLNVSTNNQIWPAEDGGAKA